MVGTNSISPLACDNCRLHCSEVLSLSLIAQMPPGNSLLKDLAPLATYLFWLGRRKQSNYLYCKQPFFHLRLSAWVTLPRGHKA